VGGRTVPAVVMFGLKILLASLRRAMDWWRSGRHPQA